MDLIDLFLNDKKIYMSANCAQKHSKYKGVAEKIIADGWRWDLFVGKYYKWVEVK